jgi:hypothetical protein
MKGAPRRHRHTIRACRVAISKEDEDRNMRVALAGIQDASRLVGDQLAVRK